MVLFPYGPVGEGTGRKHFSPRSSGMKLKGDSEWESLTSDPVLGNPFKRQSLLGSRAVHCPEHCEGTGIQVTPHPGHFIALFFYNSILVSLLAYLNFSLSSVEEMRQILFHFLDSETSFLAKIQDENFFFLFVWL